MEKKEIQPSKFEKRTSNIMSQTLTQLAEGITGIVSSKREELILSVGHIVQRLRAGQFLSTLLNEWNKFREKGGIKEDYQYTEQHKSCLQELLDFLDKDLPDEIRFSALKKIFLVAATEKITDRNSTLPLQFMQICRTLSSGEILVLVTVYQIAKTDAWKIDRDRWSALDWLNKVAEESGLKYLELVETHENALIKKYLLKGRIHPDRSGVRLGKHFGLTSLGYEICSYVEHYDAS